MIANKQLDRIGLAHGTDKASSHHDYLNFYEQFLAPYRDKEVTILEVGVLGGASLRTWQEYFPKATIIGADINPTTKRFQKDRIEIEILDQSNIEELVRLGISRGPFDVVIEDGSHIWEHQITSLRTLFPFVTADGIYIVEDLQTNYGVLERRYKGVARESCVEYLKKWVDLRVGDEQIDLAKVEDAFLRTYGRSIQFMAFHRRSCLIKKQFVAAERTIDVGEPLVELGNDARRQYPLLTAHIGLRGDVASDKGYVNFGSDEVPFQGIALETDLNVLEYCVRQDQSWSSWCEDGKFCGTRGKSIAIDGVIVRVSEEKKTPL